MRTQLLAAATLLMVLTGITHAQSKIAVANPSKILNELAETKDINKAIESELATFRQQAEERDSKLKDLQGQKEALKPGTPQWEEVNKKFIAEKATRDSWAQSTQSEIFRKLRDQARRMNDKITAAVGEVAKDKGFDLVLAEQRPEATDQQLEQMNPQQLTQFLFARNVLYKTDAVDITQDVIAKLDGTYQAK